MSSANCSNNSTIPSIGQNSFLIGSDKTQSIISQPVTPLHTPQYNLRPPNLSNTISPISFKTDTELLSQLSPDELIYRIKSLETKNRKLLFENGCLIRDLNSNLANIQYCKHQMLQLKKDNIELRDLCCYLDDERTKARILIAQEWGYKLKKEINNYSHKLRQLEEKQFELVKENYELKQLCLLMDKAMINKQIETDLDSNDNRYDKNADEKRDDKLIDDKDDKRGDNKDDKRDDKIVNIKFEKKNEKTNTATDATSDRIKKNRSLLNYKVLNYIKLLETKLEQCSEYRNSTLDLLNKDVSLEQSIREFEKFELNLDDLNNRRPTEIKNAMEILKIEQSLDHNLNKEIIQKTDDQIKETDNQLKTSTDFKLNEDLNENQINEDQRSIIKQLCTAAYKQIEDEA